jgi:hypothetical protein
MAKKADRNGQKSENKVPKPQKQAENIFLALHEGVEEIYSPK